jgi:hypothetical protein
VGSRPLAWVVKLGRASFEEVDPPMGIHFLTIGATTRRTPMSSAVMVAMRDFISVFGRRTREDESLYDTVDPPMGILSLYDTVA